MLQRTTADIPRDENGNVELFCSNCADSDLQIRMDFTGKTVDREGKVFSVWTCNKCLAQCYFWDQKDKRFLSVSQHGDGEPREIPPTINEEVQ